MIMPHAIGDHAPKERIVRVGNPLGKLGASLLVRRVIGQSEIRLNCLDRRDARGGYGSNWIEHVATIKHLRDAGVLRDDRVHAGGLGSLGEQALNGLAHTGQLVGSLSARFALIRRECFGDLCLGNSDCAHAGRSGDFFRCESAIVKTPTGNGAVEHTVGAGSGTVPYAEGKVRAVFGESVEAGLVRFAIGFAVAITGNAAVSPVNNREVYWLLSRLGFLAAGERFGSHESIAASHPALGLAFAGNDGVEEGATVIL